MTLATLREEAKAYIRMQVGLLRQCMVRLTGNPWPHDRDVLSSVLDADKNRVVFIKKRHLLRFDMQREQEEYETSVVSRSFLRDGK